MATIERIVFARAVSPSVNILDSLSIQLDSDKSWSCHSEFGRRAKLLTAIEFSKSRAFCKFGSAAASHTRVRISKLLGFVTRKLTNE